VSTKTGQAQALDVSLTFGADVVAEGIRTEEMLTTMTDEHKKRVELVKSANVYYEQLSKYFANLEALAKGDQSAATSTALGSLIDTLKVTPLNFSLSDEKKSALTGLAALIGKQIHAAKLKSVLTVGADPIAQSIELANAMYDEQERWIRLRVTQVIERQYAIDVKTPFVSNAILGNEWKALWKAYVRGPTVIELLEKAKKSNGEMLEAWKGVLRGEYSFGELQASIMDVNAALDAIIAVKSAK
jgi:hypothetical protein